MPSKTKPVQTVTQALGQFLSQRPFVPNNLGYDAGARNTRYQYTMPDGKTYQIWGVILNVSEIK